MKIMKRLQALIIVAALLCSTMAVTACGKEEASGEKEYKVAIKDAYGTPYKDGVVVLFMQNGTQVAMQVVDKETGVATKTMEAGDYEVKLQFTGDANAFRYNEEGLKLTADKTELDVILNQSVTGEAHSLFAGGEDCDAYDIYTGSTYVELESGERNYFIFTPTEAGTYEFSIMDNSDLTLGYYGVSHYVHDNTITEPVDGKITVSISKQMVNTGETGTTNLVIGIDADTATECVLGITRIGDAEWTIEDAEWEVYKATDAITKYTLPEGVTFKDFDLTASGYTVVYNETDGYYHLNTADGPLIYVNLVKENKYMESFQGVLEEAGVAKYYYDADGKFVKRVSFAKCLLDYIAAADEETGVYPLNKDLKYIIQEHGDFAGWWKLGTPTSIFVDNNWNPIPGINADIAWLFMCCYAE